MKKKVILLCMLLPALIYLMPVSAFANQMYALDNYFAVHSNKAGTDQRLKDKRGDAILYGDTLEHDAQIISVSFVKEGLQPGEKLYIIHPDGSKQTVTGDTANLNPKSENIRIAIDKTTNKETLVKVLMMTVKDASDGGTLVDYLYAKDTPRKYGDLGDGAGGGGTDPGGGVTGIDLQWNAGTRRFTWTKWPSDAYQIVVTDPDGKKVNVTPSTKVFKADERAGTYKFEVKDMNGKVLYTKSMTVPAAEGDPPDPGGGDPPDPGGGDPPDPGGGTGGCGSACDRIKEALECPGFDEYLGKWADMIRGTYPPPPDWHYVADVMKDSIVPAMGSEIVNRAPEIADIIADEFESREKQVSPPPSIDPFRPDLPRFQDVQEARDDLNRDVPGFHPDYSEDKGFVIPDPANIKFEDTSDQGYTYNPAPVDRPNYQQDGPDPSDGDIEYKASEQTPGPPPDYQNGPEQPGQAPGYETPPEAPQPGYEGSEGDGGSEDYQHRDDPYREYEGR